MNAHLYRSREDRMLAGVAGGLAEIWDADPSLIRIVWALLVVLTGGLALLVYIVMAIVVPDEDVMRPATASVEDQDARRAAREARAAAREARRERGGRSSVGIVIGAALILLGGVFLLREWWPSLDYDWLGPLVLVGIGIVLLAFAFTRDTGSGGTSA